jgi:glyoxylase-like metal-dependent hydrolase (beta-lactamase superfamily II)
MKIGRFEIHSFVEQHFRLDGGMMFGVVPKVLWRKLIEADEDNLIPMTTNLFVLKANGKNHMFDAGLGDTLSEFERKVYSTDGVSSMDEGLAGLGLTTDDIDYVILTHLHTDHGAGAVKRRGGEYVPRFAHATYLATKEEFDVAVNPSERTRAVYEPARYHALKESGQLELIDANSELFPGINAVFTGGHTEGHFALEIESEGQRVFYYADIYPSRHHMPVPYVPATDVYPLQSMEARRKSLPKIVDRDVIMAFDHDTAMPFARIRKDGKRFVAEPVADEK